MKNLQFKLDTIGSLVNCIGVLLVAYAFYTSTIDLSWIGYVGALLSIIGFATLLMSKRITHFIEGKKE